MKYFFLITLFLFVSSYLWPQEIGITFNVVSDKVNDTSSVFISGNDPKLGDWNPSRIKLNKVNNTEWKINLSFHKGTVLEYKFTLGEWDMEALDNKGLVPSNSHLTVSKDTTVYIKINDWGTGSPNKIKFKGKITGNLKYHRNFPGKGLLPRDIVVWLPPSYDKETQKRYPVLYAHDAQNLFDPETSSFGVDWQLDETADSLIKQEKIKEIIIVGINNSQNRMKEYYTGDTGETYLKFIVNELKPFIDKTYRTLSNRKNTATIGSSAGGLIAFMLLWEYNKVFSKAACISPAFHIEDIDYITPVNNSKGKRKDIKVYIDCGGTGLDSLLLTGAKEMISALDKKGYKNNKDYLFFYDKIAEHNEPNWAKRVWRPLEFFYEIKKF
jgi:predicted alpha/beta superfamily hydrolase